jgi:hypothetical protein
LTEKSLNFSEWISFEAERIVDLGMQVAAESRADYMKLQIHCAIYKAFAHGRDGLSMDDPPRPLDE